MPKRDNGDYGRLVGLVSTGQASSRTELARLTGLARSTISQRVDALLQQGLFVQTGDGLSTGGRRPQQLSLNPAAGVLLAAAIGATRCSLAVASLDGHVLAERCEPLEIALGPAMVLSEVVARFKDLLEATGRQSGDVRAIGVGVPGPVEFSTGTVVRPPIMPGWDGFVVPDGMQERSAALG